MRFRPARLASLATLNPSAALDPHLTPAGDPAMTPTPIPVDTTDAHPSDASPEVADLLARLDRLPANYRSTIGDAALHAAENAAFRREHTEALLAVRSNLNTALASRDLAAAESAAARLLVLGALDDGDNGVSHLPSTALDAQAVAQLHQAIAADLGALVGDPRAQTLDFAVDLDRWRGLPALLRTHGAQALVHDAAAEADPPGSTVEDVAAKRSSDAFTAKHAAFVDNVNTVLVNRGAGDPLGIAASATDLAKTGAELANEAARIDELVVAANEARHSAGLMWAPPAVVAQALGAAA